MKSNLLAWHPVVLWLVCSSPPSNILGSQVVKRNYEITDDCICRIAIDTCLSLKRTSANYIYYIVVKF